MRTFKEDLEEFCKIYEYCKIMIDTMMSTKIITHEDSTWKHIHDKIFSEDLYHRAQSIYKFEHYDNESPRHRVLGMMRRFEHAYNEAQLMIKEMESTNKII